MKWKTQVIVHLLFILSILNTYSQNSEVIKFRTTDISFKYLENNNKWNNWTEWEPADLLVVFNFNKKQIKIYSQETQIFDIVSVENDKKKKSEKLISFKCIDKDGVECLVEYWEREDKKNEDYLQLYIKYVNLKYVYSLFRT